MKILIIGNGGREHAIAWKLHQSEQVTEILSTPKNSGIARIGRCFDIPVESIDDILKLAQSEHIDLTVVGPEVPLSLGIVDRFRSKGLPIFGPTQAAARIESSKGFAKNLMKKYNVPTAAFQSFSSDNGLEAYIRSFPLPPVIKADGLAAGKGVVVAQTHDEAVTEAKAMLSGNRFGSAGASIVVEERMSGPEASLFALTDGVHFQLLATAQDHKRAYDHDQGPNTGGMGAYAPATLVNPSLLKTIGETILWPVLHGMKEEGCPYTGMLYAGLMLTPKGPKVIEFNCRFGDPETQVILPLLDGDLPDALLASVNGTVDRLVLKQKPGAAVTVVLASGGYPGDYAKGKVISGVEQADATGAVVFHAGTAMKDGSLVTAGGRVLNVTATGETLKEAIDKAYAAADKISFDGKMIRQDIGKKGLSE